jgi:anti-anti-sigma regulatory factor
MLGSADTTSPEPFTGAFGIIQSEPDEQTAVVALEGELDLERAPSLKWALVDRSLSAGSRMAIVCTNVNVLKIFELSGMDGAFAIFPTPDEAIAHVRGHTMRIG